MIKRWLNPLLMFIWLSTGYGVFHCIGMAWIMVPIMAIFGQAQVHENLYITEDLQPVIGSWDSDAQQQVYRQLDGTRIASGPGQMPRFLNLTQLTPNSAETTVELWRDRICPLNDYQRPATYWYFVAPPGFGGAGYFSGYQEVSRRHVGYIDREGFTTEEPTVERSFPIVIHPYSYWQRCVGALAAAQLSTRSYQGLQEPNWVSSWSIRYDNTTHDAVWLLSGDKIYEIQLGSRTVRTLVENRSDLRYLMTEMSYERDETRMTLLVRTDAGVSLFDPRTGEEKKIPFAREFAADWESFGWAHARHGDPDQKPTQYVLERHHPIKGMDESRISMFAVLDSEGNVVRSQEVKLSINQGTSQMGIDLFMSACLPLPLASLGAITIGPLVAPNEFTKTGATSTPHQNYLRYFRRYLISSLLIGLATGWAARRRERDVFGSSSWLWPVLVGAAGWFGWIAYICIRPLPARIAGQSWITSTPAPIQRLGTEIFA